MFHTWLPPFHSELLTLNFESSCLSVVLYYKSLWPLVLFNESLGYCLTILYSKGERIMELWLWNQERNRADYMHDSWIILCSESCRQCSIWAHFGQHNGFDAKLIFSKTFLYFWKGIHYIFSQNVHKSHRNNGQVAFPSDFDGRRLFCAKRKRLNVIH